MSAASIWEVAIKARLGKIAAGPHELAAAIEPSGFLELPIRAAHAAGVKQLELHHNEPFGRLLIAQALAEPLKLLTADQVLARYSDIVVVARAALASERRGSPCRTIRAGESLPRWQTCAARRDRG